MFGFRFLSGVVQLSCVRLARFFNWDEDSMTRIKTTRANAFTVLLSCMLVTSCATTPFSSASSNDDYLHKVSYLPENISNFLKDATAGQSFFMERGPQGGDAQVQVLERYFSASGRTCLSVLVETNQSVQPMLFCQYDSERWGATRALIKNSVQ